MPRPPRTEFRAAISSPPDTVDDAHDFLLRAWEDRPDVLPADRMAIETAFSELVTNIIVHNPGRPVACEVVLLIEPEAIEVRTTDTGFRPDVTPQGSMPDSSSEHGRGLALIEMLTDLLEYRRGDEVNHWRLRRSRSD